MQIKFGALIVVSALTMLPLVALEAQETVKKLYINSPQLKAPPSSEKAEPKSEKQEPPTESAKPNPPPAPPSRTAPPPPPTNSAVNMEDIDKLIKEGPFSVFANPKFKKFMDFLTNKKMITALNELADKSKIKFMLVGQLLLIILSLVLRSAVTANTRGFLATFFANTWIAGLHIFLATIVLPRYLYGPHYFDLLTELYKVITAQS